MRQEARQSKGKITQLRYIFAEHGNLRPATNSDFVEVQRLKLKKHSQETEVHTRNARPFFSNLPTARSRSSSQWNLQTSLPSHETHEAWVDPCRFLESNASKISAFDHLWRLNLAPGKIQDSGLQLLHMLHKPDSTGFQGYHHQNSLLRANKSLTQTAPSKNFMAILKLHNAASLSLPVQQKREKDQDRVVEGTKSKHQTSDWKRSSPLSSSPPKMSSFLVDLTV